MGLLVSILLSAIVMLSTGEIGIGLAEDLTHRTATSRADRETICDMRIRPGRERGDFLVPDMQPLNAAMAARRIGEAIEAVAHDSLDALNAGGGEGFDH